MKKKVLFCTLLSVVVLALGLVLSSSNSVNVESEKGHDCSEHLAQVKSLHPYERCLNCFSYPDEWGACPRCDYRTCINCGEEKFLIPYNFCTHCGDIDQIKICKNCGETYIECECETPVFD